MTALLVLLLAAASAVDSFDWVGGRPSRASVRARLLVGVPVVAVLGVLVGWPILHLGAEGVVVVILVTIAWLCCGLVPRTWWERLLRSRQREQVGRCGSEGGADRAMRLARLARVGLLLLAVALCVVVCQPLGSRAAKMSAVVGVVVFLAVPANRIVSDILAAARQSHRWMNGRAARSHRCVAVAGSARLSAFSSSCSPLSRLPLLLPQSFAAKGVIDSLRSVRMRQGRRPRSS